MHLTKDQAIEVRVFLPTLNINNIKMKTIVKIVIIVLVILNISCGTIKPNIMIGPTGDTQKTYIEDIKYYNNISD